MTTLRDRKTSRWTLYLSDIPPQPVKFLAVGGSYSKFSNNCRFFQLAVKKYCFQVVVDGVGVHFIQRDHHFLGEPHVFIGINSLNAAHATGGDEAQVRRC